MKKVKKKEEKLKHKRDKLLSEEMIDKYQKTLRCVQSFIKSPRNPTREKSLSKSIIDSSNTFSYY